MNDDVELPMLDAGALSDTTPQCSCACHNNELGNAEAEIDWAGHYHPDQRPDFWRDNPRYVDRRDEAHAVAACSGCRPLHAMAYADDPMKVWAAEKAGLAHLAEIKRTRGTKGGPQGQCEPDCRYCKGLDSIWSDHK